MPGAFRIARRPIVLLALLVVLAIGGVILAAWLSSPRPSDLSQRLDEQLRTLGSTPVPLASIAPVMQHAIVATEDERFYNHHGVDAVGVLRALAYDLSHLSAAQGASTITEQLAKLVYLGGDDDSLWRKLQSAAIAWRIESDYSKSTILADYLNLVYYGENAYGIKAASRLYFGVPPSQLSLAQASLLAGLPQSPSAYDPLTNPRAARERQLEVLRSMVRNNYVSAPRAERVLERPLPLARGPSLPPYRGQVVDPGPPLAASQLIAGVALVAAGVCGFALARTRRLSRVPRVLSVLAVVTGFLVAAGAVRVI